MDQTVQQTNDVFRRIAHGFFNMHSLAVLFVSLAVALILGRVLAAVLRGLVTLISHRVDRSPNLSTVNHLRRLETYIVISIAIIRSVLVLFAVYFWWQYVHPTAKPTTIIASSAVVAILLSSAMMPVLRDLVFGAFMMAEQWYSVGDYVKFEPFWDIEGVVEQVTLRSTRIRTLNGEIVRMGNQNISGVHVTPKGIRTIGLELFVDDAKAGERLIRKANRRLPQGPLLLVSPLTVVSNEKVGDNLWHISAIAETAPGREWLIEKSAVEIIQWMDKQSRKPIIAHGPLARYADPAADRTLRRTVQNARKRPTPKRSVIRRRDAKPRVA